jgi:hypothetical protein
VTRDVGRAGDLVLVPRDEHAVLRAHEVRLDVVGPESRAELIRGERVLGPVARGAPVRDHERLGVPPLVIVVARSAGAGDGHPGAGDDEEQGEREQAAGLHERHAFGTRDGDRATTLASASLRPS